MDVKKFTGREGQLISAEKATEFTSPYQRREQEFVGRGQNFVKAEFFGIHTFNELIDLYSDRCVGFRVYYGEAEEEEFAKANEKARLKVSKLPTSRLIIVPVDAYGNDLTTAAHLGGLKDMPAARDAMRGGPLCPSDC